MVENDQRAMQSLLSGEAHSQFARGFAGSRVRAHRQNARGALPFAAGKKVAVRLVDGAAAANKELRGRLWDASKVRTYPLLFAVPKGWGEEGTPSSARPRFLGAWPEVSALNESNAMTQELDKMLNGLVRTA